MKSLKFKKMLACWPLLCALIITATVYVSGCLTPQQQAVMREAIQAKENAVLVLASLEPEIAGIRKMVAEGKISEADAKPILKGMLARRKAVKGTIKENVAAIKKMQDAEMPWYAWLFYGLNVAAGIGGSFLGVRKVGNVANAFGTVSRALDTHMATVGADNADVIRATIAKVASEDGTAKAVKALHNEAVIGKI